MIWFRKHFCGCSGAIQSLKVMKKQKHGYFFTGFFSHLDNEYLDQSGYDLRENVKTNVFSDQDEHVNIEVLEMFSDGMTTFMTVKYTAIDEQGQTWLADNTEWLGRSLFLRPVIPGNNAVKYGVNWMSGGRLLEEMSTDTEKYYCVTMQASGINYSSDMLAFQYPVTEQDEIPLEESRQYWVVEQDGNPLQYIRETDFPSVSNIDFTVYEMTATGDMPQDLTYEPEYLYVSSLSYLIKGKNWTVDDTGMEPLQIGIELQFEDGNTYDAGRSTWGLTTHSELEQGYVQEELFGGAFRDDDDWLKSRTFDPQKVEKVTLQGVEYELRKCRE